MTPTRRRWRSAPPVWRPAPPACRHARPALPRPIPPPSTLSRRPPRACKGLKTMTAELRLSGRAGAERLRGTLLAGLAAPASIRFEAVAPFGRPSSSSPAATIARRCSLPRDNRVLPRRRRCRLLERLTGVEPRRQRPPADHHRLSGRVRDWQRRPGFRRRMAVGHARRATARTSRSPRISGRSTARASSSPPTTAPGASTTRIIMNGFPRSVRIRSAEGGPIDHLRARSTSSQINAGIDDKAFEVTVPPRRWR